MPTNINYIIAAGATALGIVVGWMAYHTFKRQEKLDAKVFGSIISVIVGASVIGIFQKIAGSTSGLPQEIYLYPVGLLIGVVATATIKFIGVNGGRSEELSTRLPEPAVEDIVPRVTMLEVLATGPDKPGLTYPVKCYVTFRNDSATAVDVRISEYKPTVVTLKKFVQDVIQIKFRVWLPTDEGVDRVAVYQGQLFKAWLGVDESKFDAPKVNSLRGKIGTLTLLVNNKPQGFDL